MAQQSATSNALKHITVTVIWDGHALNRDEKIGGNILSIKKINRSGRTYSFIGKPAIRHYLWETLRKAEGWKPAPAEVQQKVVQFSLHRHNVDIRTHEELDLFGYMYTYLKESKKKSKEETGGTLARKAVIGITKAIAIEDFAGDMAFYANHDLVSRARQQGFADTQPNPYNKEEHASFYQASFTLDLERLGRDRWIVDPQSKLPKQRDDLQWSDFGQGGSSYQSCSFSVPAQERLKRILAVLRVLYNGLVAQSSGETNPLVPVFFLALPVSVPVPVAHTVIAARVNAQGKLEIEGVSDALKNGWVAPVGGKSGYLYAAKGRVESIDGKSLEQWKQNDNIAVGKGWKDFEEKFWKPFWESVESALPE